MYTPKRKLCTQMFNLEVVATPGSGTVIRRKRSHHPCHYSTNFKSATHISGLLLKLWPIEVYHGPCPQIREQLSHPRRSEKNPSDVCLLKSCSKQKHSSWYFHKTKNLRRRSRPSRKRRLYPIPGPYFLFTWS